MKKYLVLFLEILKKEFIIWKRYLFNSLGSLITIYFVFLLIFMGYSGIARGNPDFGSGLEGLVVGYLLWVFALMTYSDISYSIRAESQEGTLEQLYMSPFGFTLVAGFRLISSFFLNFIFITVLLVAMVLTTSRSLHLDLLSIMPLLIITLLGIAGIGFLFGGLTLLFKRVESYLQIVQFLLIGLVAAPVGKYPLFKCLPAALGASLIREVMVDEKSITAFLWSDFLFLLCNSLFYLLLGYLVFKWCERRAMFKGLLGHY